MTGFAGTAHRSGRSGDEGGRGSPGVPAFPHTRPACEHVSMTVGADGNLDSAAPGPLRRAATILHADLDAFYASVEQRDDPALRGRPVIVGGGVVLAASYEAKARGVRTAMGGERARRLCPEAVVVPPRMWAYSAASKAVFEVFRQTTPLVEAMSIDEAFLDVGGLGRLAGPPADIAARLRVAVQSEVGLAITVGVARTKFLAKVASMAKPDGLLVVSPEAELDFLHPLPVQRLWGVGPKTTAKLHDHGIHTVREVAALGQAALVSLVGQGAGRHLHALAHNHDPRSVVVGTRRGSIGSQHALGHLTRDPAEIDAVLMGCVDRVARRLRAAQRSGRTVTLRLRFGDFTRVTRSHTLARGTSSTDTVLQAARSLVAAAMPLIGRHGLTLVGIAVSGFEADEAEQLSFSFDRKGDERLDQAWDAVRGKYGAGALTRGTLVNKGAGLEMPLLPD